MNQVEKGTNFKNITDLTRHLILTELLEDDFLVPEQHLIDQYKPNHLVSTNSSVTNDPSTRARKRRKLTPKEKARRKQRQQRHSITSKVDARTENKEQMESPEIQKLLDEISDQENENTCKLCVDNPMETVLLPCGHFALCYSCSIKMVSCPVCRTLIDSTVNINTSGRKPDCE